MSLLNDFWKHRNLIFKLSLNDFKTKYAGSYLGILWGFINPVVTVLVFWFVFQVGFRATPVSDYPFVLWLVCGLMPWFLFSDALNGATNCLFEYSYLVKKVVFKVSVLPIVKIISAFYVHIFFLAFVILLFLINGIGLTIYSLQLIYYSLCLFIYILGISYFTSAVAVFLKDLSQLIIILLQVGMWMTPIMWNISIVPDKYVWIFKLNPMFYIIDGYRDSFIGQIWFWEKYNQFFYFHIVIAIVFIIGALTFKVLKPHFSDML